MKSSMRISFLISLLIYCSLATGAVIRVPTDYTTIQSAVNIAGINDTVLVANGIYSERVFVRGSHLTIAGAFIFTHDSTDVGNLTIRLPASVPVGNDSASVFVIQNCSSIKLIGFTVRDGRGFFTNYRNIDSCIFGGGILCDSSDLTLEHIRLTHNTAGTGGGLCLRNSNLYMTHCLIDSCSGIGLGNAGGAIYTLYCDSIVIDHSSFLNNRHNYYTGALHIVSFQYGIIQYCSFYNNYAFRGSGSLSATNVKEITNNRFYGNSSLAAGAIWYVLTDENQSYKISDNLFMGNYCVTDTTQILPPTTASAIIVQAAISTHSLIENNVFDGNGPVIDGTIVLQGGHHSLKHNSFMNNYATKGSVFETRNYATILFDSNFVHGNINAAYGALYAYSSSSVTGSYNDFIGNRIVANYVTGSPISLQHCYWGDPSGPRVSDNPTGRGDTISDSIAYRPWLTTLVFPQGIQDRKYTIVSPTRFNISLIQPNPFNFITTIKFELSQRRNIELSLCDLSGREVEVLFHGVVSAGSHSTTFDGRRFASGTYFVRLRAGNEVSAKKVVLLK